MSRQRFASLAVVALLVISGALYFSNRRNASMPNAGGALFPGLSAQLNAVTSVTLRKGAAAPATTLHESAGQWRVAQRGDYPADVVKLRRLLSAVRDARIIEEKTGDPARYAEIGVEDASQPRATGAEIIITAPAATFGLIVGKTVGEGNFVRRSGEKISYSVEPAIALETEPRSWIDARLLDVPAARIERVDFKPAAGAGYSIHHVSATDNSFALDGMPKGRQALEAGALAPSPNTLTGLDAEDVSPLGDVDFGKSSQAVVTLTDGAVLTITGVVLDTRHWVQISSSKDAALTAKTAGRAFEIASYRYDGIFKPLDQFLLPQAKPQPAKPQHAAPAS